MQRQFRIQQEKEGSKKAKSQTQNGFVACSQMENGFRECLKVVLPPHKHTYFHICTMHMVMSDIHIAL